MFFNCLLPAAGEEVKTRRRKIFQKDYEKIKSSIMRR